MLQSLQVLKNVYIKYQMSSHAQIISSEGEKHPNKHILVLRHVKHHTPVFS